MFFNNEKSRFAICLKLQGTSVTRQCCQVVYYETRNPNLAISEAFAMEGVGVFLAIWYIYVFVG
jgi:hypothetical protein